MTEPAGVSSSTTRRKRKIRTLLAAGLVLGVGVGATLAAFSDSIFGTGTVGTGVWDIEASVTTGLEGTYSDFPGPTGGGLVFALPPASTQMVPGSRVYAPIWIRTKGTTTYTVPVKLVNATYTGNAALAGALLVGVKYGVTCDGTAAGFTGGTVFPGTTLDSPLGSGGSGSSTVDIPKGSGGNPGTAIKFCFNLTLSTNADQATTQGKTVTPTWQFLSSSP